MGDEIREKEVFGLSKAHDPFKPNFRSFKVGNLRSSKNENWRIIEIREMSKFLKCLKDIAPLFSTTEEHR